MNLPPLRSINSNWRAATSSKFLALESPYSRLRKMRQPRRKRRQVTGVSTMKTCQRQLARGCTSAEAAAKEWNVAPAGLVAANAKVTDPASSRSIKYAELARGKTLAQNLPAEDPITPATEWTIAGKAIPKVDGRAFVTGRHQYTTDLHPAGMLYGKVLRPPSFGATLTSFRQNETNAMTGD